jgi:hypothetical protein
MQDPDAASSAVVTTPGSPPATPVGRPWTPEEVELLEERRKLAWSAQHAYYERSSILTALNYLIGIPVVMVTALAGSEIVAGHASDTPVALWVGVITVSATVLASLQTFFRFGERAAFSAVAGAKYARVRRRIEDCITISPADHGKALLDLRKLIEDAEEQSPPIGERRWLTWQRYADSGPPRRRPMWRAVLGIPGPNERLRKMSES